MISLLEENAKFLPLTVGAVNVAVADLALFILTEGPTPT
jgi:hypothetical protein